MHPSIIFLTSGGIVVAALALVTLNDRLTMTPTGAGWSWVLVSASVVVLASAALVREASLELRAGVTALSVGVAAFGLLSQGRSARVPHVARRTSLDTSLESATGGAWRWLPLVGCALAAPVLWFPQIRPSILLPTVVVCVLILLLAISVRRRCWTQSPLGLPLFLLVAVAAVAYATSIERGLVLPKGSSFLLGLTTYSALLALTERHRPRSALCVAVGLGLLFALVGLTNGVISSKVATFAWARERLPHLLVELPGTQNGRVSMNQLGGALLLVLPVLWTCSVAALGAGGWRQGRGLTGVLVTLLLSATLILTQSRASWLGLAIALAVSLGLGSPISRYILIAVSFSVLLGWILWGRESLSPLITEMVTAPRGPMTVIGSLSLSGRVSIWQATLDAIADSPCLGCGWGSLRGTSYTHAHNVFIQVAYDMGLPGLVAYLAIVFATIRHCWRIGTNAGGNQRPIALGCIAALIGFHVYGLFDVVALGSKPGILWWCLLALATTLVAERSYDVDTP